jgi:hypothetical protein
VLSERIPETVLSEQGFQVLKGLLTCNPENRFTAAAALKLPWFNGVDATELPIKKKARRHRRCLCVKEDEEAGEVSCASQEVEAAVRVIHQDAHTAARTLMLHERKDLTILKDILNVV